MTSLFDKCGVLARFCCSADMCKLGWASLNGNSYAFVLAKNLHILIMDQMNIFDSMAYDNLVKSIGFHQMY